MTVTIASLVAREILDSRGQPTVWAELALSNGLRASASVPSGASCGLFEACELRDDNPKRYEGRGVLRAVQNVNEIIEPKIQGMTLHDLARLDAFLIELDGTPNKSYLGANAILAVSLAARRVGALAAGLPLFAYLSEGESLSLPVPMMNILNGGAHADNNVDIQEFMIMPVGAGAFSDALRMGSEVFYALKSLLKSRDLATGVGDEGGFAPMLRSNAEALDLIMEAISRAGYTPGKDIFLSLDLASSHFYREGKYCLQSENLEYTADEFITYLSKWVDQYPILSMEDPMQEEDWEGWEAITSRLGHRLQLVGDDIFVTQTARLERGIKQRVANAILIKPNQVGTVSETLAAIRLAKQFGYQTVCSHRSGETEDPFIADLAVAEDMGQIKTGSLCRGERIAKYNRLLEIEAALGRDAVYKGCDLFSGYIEAA